MNPQVAPYVPENNMSVTVMATADFKSDNTTSKELLNATSLHQPNSCLLQSVLEYSGISSIVPIKINEESANEHALVYQTGSSFKSNDFSNEFIASSLTGGLEPNQDAQEWIHVWNEMSAMKFL